MAPPARKPAILAQRFPARLRRYNQTSRTGPTGAVRSEDPAAAPAIKPVATARDAPARSTATTASRYAATVRNRDSP